MTSETERAQMQKRSQVIANDTASHSPPVGGLQEQSPEPELDFDHVADQVLQTSVWPRKFTGWPEYLSDSEIDFAAVRIGLSEGRQGPWDGASGGEMRTLRLACMVADGGELAESLHGIDADTKAVFVEGLTTVVGQSVDAQRAAMALFRSD